MREMKKLIKHYWDCSVTGDFSDFPFSYFFEIFNERLYEKVALHGQLELSDYIHCVKKYYDMSELMQYAYVSKHTGKTFQLSDIIEAVFKPRYQHFRKTYMDSVIYHKLTRLYVKTLNTRGKTIEEQIKTAEECISAEHNSGRIIDVDIEELRKSYEAMITRLSVDKPFGILTRAGVEEKFLRTGYTSDVILIDIDDMKQKNKDLGYSAVNELITRVFEEFNFRDLDIVGRWFSGDEFIIIPIDSGDSERLTRRFQAHCLGYGISFKFRIFQDVNDLSFIQLDWFNQPYTVYV
jgi:GGDEF domain-containing protein